MGVSVEHPTRGLDISSTKIPDIYSIICTSTGYHPDYLDTILTPKWRGTDREAFFQIATECHQLSFLRVTCTVGMRTTAYRTDLL
jgi:hypothetical protein